METSPFNYQFTSDEEDGDMYAPHEVLPLQLLQFLNKGTPRSDGQVRLGPAAFTAENTIEDLFYDRSRYALAGHVIEGNEFVLNLSKSNSGLYAATFRLIFVM